MKKDTKKLPPVPEDGVVSDTDDEDGALVAEEETNETEQPEEQGKQSAPKSKKKHKKGSQKSTEEAAVKKERPARKLSRRAKTRLMLSGAAIGLVAVTAFVCLYIIAPKLSMTSLLQYVNTPVEVSGEQVSMTNKDGFTYALYSIDGIAYLPSDPILSALGYEGGYDQESGTYVIAKVYKGLARLLDMDMSSESTPTTTFHYLDGGEENSKVYYGKKDENGSREASIPAQYGALVWKNVDGADSDTKVNRVTFDVSGYSSLTFNVTSYGKTMVTIYTDSATTPSFSQVLEDFHDVSKPYSYTIDISNVNTISIGGISLDGSTSSYYIMANMLLAR